MAAIHHSSIDLTDSDYDAYREEFEASGCSTTPNRLRGMVNKLIASTDIKIGEFQARRDARRERKLLWTIHDWKGELREKKSITRHA